MRSFQYSVCTYMHTACGLFQKSMKLSEYETTFTERRTTDIYTHIYVKNWQFDSLGWGSLTLTPINYIHGGRSEWEIHQPTVTNLTTVLVHK